MARLRHPGQDFRRVEDARLRAFAAQFAGHVHQAAEIAAEQQVGAGGFDIAGLFADDGVGNIGIFHAESPAEAAAGLLAFERAQLQALDRAEQRARLRLDAKLAQAGAGIVIGRAGLAGDVLRAEAAQIDQKTQQFMGLGGKFFGALPPDRIVGEKLADNGP